MTNILAIQILYFCKFAQNIWNWNSFLQFKCKRIANLSQNDFQTFCDGVQIYCTLVQSKCNWYFLPLINCKKIAIFTHFESAKMLQFTAKKEWIKRMLESKLSSQIHLSMGVIKRHCWVADKIDPQSSHHMSLQSFSWISVGVFSDFQRSFVFDRFSNHLLPFLLNSDIFS